MPAGSGALGPNGEKELDFDTHADFRDWLPKFICKDCVDGAENDQECVTISDYLNSSCGCELWVDDPDEIIFWDDVIVERKIDQ
ncbi:MAG: hypothetical protein COA84_13840 [Robiginitomaculum sp.]|nr:MAG: hypothetical protein COA84_13840 [Robiginitomaculum sp.]